MFNLCNTLLPNEKAQATPADIGNTIKPIPLTDEVIEVDVAAMITILSADYNTVFRVLKFFCLFFDLLFLSLNYVIISLILLIWLLKLLTSFFSRVFFLNQYFLIVVLMGTIYRISVPFI